MSRGAITRHHPAARSVRGRGAPCQAPAAEWVVYKTREPNARLNEADVSQTPRPEFRPEQLAAASSEIRPEQLEAAGSEATQEAAPTTEPHNAKVKWG
jgi:hypothetical protein